jgi:hypothetical protein
MLNTFERDAKRRSQKLPEALGEITALIQHIVDEFGSTSS